MARLPVFFIPHGGGPCFFMDWTPAGVWDGMASYLENFAADLDGQISSVLVISAHWEEDPLRITAGSAPDLIYDYYGFPAHTYDLKWPAPGNPALAKSLADRLAQGGVPAILDPDRGFDHGVFIPFLLAFPDASLPTVQLSLSASLSPALHYQIGELIAPLRDEGVLIVGSGMSFHDVGALMGRKSVAGAAAFDDWLGSAMASQPERRKHELLNWDKAPAARLSHPREEHLLPLLVAAGSAGSDIGQRDYHETVLGADISAFRFG